MSYQPRTRSRSRRFGQPTARKASREHKEDQKVTHFYEEPAQLDLGELSSKLANALQHLGSQRFALSPFAEHFQRWLSDVDRILTEFETNLAQAVDQAYRDDTQRILLTVNEDLNRRIQEERAATDLSSNLQKQLSRVDIELSKLENDHNRQTREIKRNHEKASHELQNEINELGKQRSLLLRKKSSLLDRLFRRPNIAVEEKTSSLQSKKKSLGARQTTLNKELEKSRADYAANRKRLLQEQDTLRAKIDEKKESSQDDALEIRKRASEELQKAINSAVNRFQNQSS